MAENEKNIKTQIHNLKQGAAHTSYNPSKKETNILITHFNAQSFNVEKLEQLKLELSANSSDPDIMGISETWWNSKTQDNLMQIIGYNCFRQDREDTNKSRGGGVCIYVKQDYSCKLMKHPFPTACGNR